MMYLEVFLAALGAFMLGFLWYTALFGKVWQAETGITDTQAQSNVGLTHGLAFLLMLVIAYYINGGAGYHKVEEQTFVHGAFHGGYNALKYALPAIGIHYLYQRKSLKLFLIDGVYVLLFFAIMGAITYGLKLG